MDSVRISGIVKESIVDGEGIRYVVFTQGCFHNCVDCHNPATHNPDGGEQKPVDTIIDEIISNPLIKGVTFSGGEPFLQPKPLAAIAVAVKAHGKDVWVYSGYTFEELSAMSDKRVLLEQIDVLVDGRFELTQRDLTLRFRGSANQRVLDCKQSLASGSAVLYFK